MPEQLWQAVVRLARKRGVWATARALKVSYESLSRRMVVAGKGSDPLPGPAGFVELRAAPALSWAPGGTAVEMVGVRGEKLTIRLAPGERLDVAAVAHTFLGRR